MQRAWGLGFKVLGPGGSRVQGPGSRYWPSALDPNSSFLDPNSSFLDPRPSSLEARPSALGPAP
eukprot:422620-Rhodomonas_salina.1